MAVTPSQPEWFYDSLCFVRYGVIESRGKWAVIRPRAVEIDMSYDVISPWVDSRETAVGFIKLMMEN